MVRGRLSLRLLASLVAALPGLRLVLERFHSSTEFAAAFAGGPDGRFYHPVVSAPPRFPATDL